MSVLRISGGDRFLDLSHRAFVDEMVAHLGALSPALAQPGDARLRAMIGLGIARANDHGLELRGPVRLYLELMVLLGSSFDTDPRYPWAAQLLAEEGAMDPMRCAQQLHVHAMVHLEQVDGPALKAQGRRRKPSHPHGSRADAMPWDTVVQACGLPMVFKERLRAIDEASGEPIPDLAYRIELEDGSVITGHTDEQGRTRQVVTDQAQLVKVQWGAPEAEEATDADAEEGC